MKTSDEVLQELNEIVPGWEYSFLDETTYLYFEHEHISIIYDVKHNWYTSVSNVYSTDETLLRGFGYTATEALYDIRKLIEEHYQEIQSILNSIKSEHNENI